MTLPLLCAFSFLAGVIDAIVGGGGPGQLPALLILLPGESIPTLFGTDKLASTAGTAMASFQYSRRVSAKVIKLATNLASVIYFASTSHILYPAAAPMAICNVSRP